MKVGEELITVLFVVVPSVIIGVLCYVGQKNIADNKRVKVSFIVTFITMGLLIFQYFSVVRVLVPPIEDLLLIARKVTNTAFSEFALVGMVAFFIYGSIYAVVINAFASRIKGLYLLFITLIATAVFYLDYVSMYARSM